AAGDASGAGGRWVAPAADRQVLARGRAGRRGVLHAGGRHGPGVGPVAATRQPLPAPRPRVRAPASCPAGATRQVITGPNCARITYRAQVLRTLARGSGC